MLSVLVMVKEMMIKYNDDKKDSQDVDVELHLIKNAHEVPLPVI